MTEHEPFKRYNHVVSDGSVPGVYKRGVGGRGKPEVPLFVFQQNRNHKLPSPFLKIAISKLIITQSDANAPSGNDNDVKNVN